MTRLRANRVMPQEKLRVGRCPIAAEVAGAIVLVELKAVRAQELVLEVDVTAERNAVENERRDRDLKWLAVVELLLTLSQGKARDRESRKVRVRFQVEVLDLVFAAGAIGSIGDHRALDLERSALKQGQAALKELGLEQREAGRIEPDG